jgi:hypothetical protein
LDIRALHAGVDPAKAQKLAEDWSEVGNILGIPLDVHECFDRDVARTVEQYVQGIAASDAEITVVIPRREYPRLVQKFLHDRTSREIARLLADEPHVDVVVVPYRLHPAHHDGGRKDRPVVTATTASTR